MIFGSSTESSVPAFIVNRNAGRFRADPRQISRLEHAVGKRGTVLTTRTLADLDEAAARVFADLSPTVVLCGGDGSYLAGMTALERARNGRPMPKIVFARGGTVSIVARNWGRDRTLAATVRRVAHHGETLKFVSRPTLAVTASGETRIGFTFGTGLVANFFTEYERAGAGGNRVALGIAARVFVDALRGGAFADRILSPLPCKVIANGAALEPGAFSLVLCSVLRDVGLHMLVAHRAGEDVARPHLVASPLLPRALAPQVARVVLGKPLVGEGNFDGLVNEFRVEFADASGPFVVDGDTFHARSVSVKAGPVIRVAR
jgi:diacylglycerol kinase (ATP)